MSDLESLVRQHFSAEATDVDPAADLLAGVSSRRSVRRRRRTQLGSAALGIVVLLGVGIPLVGVGHGSAGPSAAIAVGNDGVPVGLRPVTWDGVQLIVPWDWTTDVDDSHRCGDPADLTPQVDYDVDHAETANICGPPPVLHLERLELGAGFSDIGHAFDHTGTPTTFAGLAAVERVDVVATQVVIREYVPSLDTYFTTTTGTEAEGRAILATARVVTVDQAGCAVEQPASLPAVTGGGGSGPVIPADVTYRSALVCAYGNGLLIRSGVATPHDLASVVSYLRQLPDAYSGSEVHSQRYWEPIFARSRGDQATLVEVRLVRTDGTVDVVAVQPPGYGKTPGVAGQTQATVTAILVRVLLQIDDFGVETGADGEIPTH